eukprot:TRINITY_DN126_c1_g1_i1.p1 TRINITY_DN126_c1_g1~~TRINITY_DN126_c1_g1_i1.p1  ORF type:complete len:188 (-),score=48.57 TRINITY_DN126_c1_g1_i1:19-582(-)
MGRVAEFSDQQIIEAGKTIVKEGKPVSTFAIRNRLNGGGSERIKAVWSNYITQQAASVEEETPDLELPAEIAEILEKNQITAKNQLKVLTVQSYKVAEQVAEKRVKSTIEDYQNKVHEFEESENQASIAIESSDKKIVELENEIALLQSRNENLISENSKLKGLFEASNNQNEQLKAKELEFEKLQR